MDSTEDVKSGKSNFMSVQMFGIHLIYLAVDMEDGAVLPLMPLETDPDIRKSGSLYATVT